MLLYGLPVLVTVFLWWFGTGVILYLDGLPRRTYRWSMLGASVLLGLSLLGIADIGDNATPAGAYLAFGYGIVVWAWLETSYLMGFVTGPLKQVCPPRVSAWRRFQLAIQTSLYHEIAITIAVAAVAVLGWGSENQIALWTLLVLWLMRCSAKLNVFLGVPNFNESFFPDHLKYLGSFLVRKRMNALFPVSITVSTMAAVVLVRASLAPGTTEFMAVGLSLISTLLVLAILEHWFLVLPLRDAALWSWALARRSLAGPSNGAETLPATPDTESGDGVDPAGQQGHAVRDQAMFTIRAARATA